MRYPMNFGMSKISMLRGEQDGPYGPVLDRNQKRAGGSGAAGSAAAKAGLAFTLSGDAAASSSGALMAAEPPSFNVLYVSTPRIGLLQTPEFQGLAALWGETMELLRPLLRFGLPETSLRTKCQHYDEDLYAGRCGIVLANDRTRTLLRGIEARAITPRTSSHKGHAHDGGHHNHHQHHNQPQHQQDSNAQLPGSASSSSSSSSSSSGELHALGPFGISTLVLLAKHVAAAQQQQAAVGQGRQKQPAPQQAPRVQQQQQPHATTALPQQEQQPQQQQLWRRLWWGRREQQPQQAQTAVAVGGNGGGGGGGAAAAAVAAVVVEQHPEASLIPRSRLLVPDLPPGSLVLGLNLMAYWAITRQARRGGMGGDLP